MGMTTAEKEALAAKVATDAPYAALFTADPGSTGTATGEVTGGTYARVALSWVAGSSDGVYTGTATLNVPAGTTITHGAICSATTGATVIVSGALTASQLFGTAGTYVLTVTYTQS